MIFKNKCNLLIIKAVVALFPIVSLGSYWKYTRPYTISNSDVKGMIINDELPKGNQLEKLGVKKNDVVLAVDFNSIFSDETAKLAFENKKTKYVTVLRGDKKVILGGKHE